MIYETRNRRLILENGERIELSNLEHRFLIALSDEKCNSLKSISEFVYKGYIDILGLRKVKTRLLKKVKLNIRTINNLGYRLEDVILYK